MSDGQRARQRTSSTSRSSAPASPGSAWRSACRAGDRRLRRARARRRRRRHLAGQHLPRLRAATCPSHLYSFSFAPNPDWTRTYSPQPEIRDYLQRCADEHDLYRTIRLGTTVPRPRGTRTPAAGRSRPPRARSPPACWSPGMGPLTEPRIPDAARASTRSRARSSTPPAGTTTTTSPASASPSIGTGASAIQFVPADPAQGRAAARVPAHAAVDHAAHATAASRDRERAALPPLARRCSRRCAPASTPAASCSCSASSSTRGS